MSSPFQKKFSGKTPFAHNHQPPKASNYEFLNSDESWEGKADRWLDFPQEKGRRETDEQLKIVPDKDGLIPEQNSFEYGDMRRHWNTANETAKAFSKKMDFLPSFISKPLGVLAANVAGGGHELNNLIDGGSLRQSLEDGFTNGWGAASSLLSEENEKKLFNIYKKFGPDGK